MTRTARTPLVALLLAAASVLLACSLAAQQPSPDPGLDQRLRFGGGLNYTVGSYSEMEGESAAALFFARRWRLDAALASNDGNYRLTAAMAYRWPVAAKLEVHAGLGSFWLPHGFDNESHHWGALALAGLERGPSDWLRGVGLDTWAYVDVQALTQRTVRLPIAAGLRFSFRPSAAPPP